MTSVSILNLGDMERMMITSPDYRISVSIEDVEYTISHYYGMPKPTTVVERSIFDGKDWIKKVQSSDDVENVIFDGMHFHSSAYYDYEIDDYTGEAYGYEYTFWIDKDVNPTEDDEE